MLLKNKIKTLKFQMAYWKMIAKNPVKTQNSKPSENPEPYEDLVPADLGPYEDPGPYLLIYLSIYLLI